MALTPVGLRFIQIVLVPYFNNQIIWSIAPLIFSLILIQMYFGRYKTEQLGWNSAFGNTITIMWVTTILFRHLHITYSSLLNSLNNFDSRGYFILTCFLAALTLFLATLNYTHKIPRKYAFLISSALPINVFAYLSIVIVMGKIPLDWNTLIASIALFIIVVLIFRFYRWIITPSKSSIPTMKKYEEIRKREARKRKRKIKKAVNKIIPGGEDKKAKKHKKRKKTKKTKHKKSKKKHKNRTKKKTKRKTRKKKK